MAFKKLTAGLMASSMILGLAATASAEITTATPFETAVKMNKLGIVVGNGTNPDGTIDFNLGGNLTRAELVTTIVRSFGAEQAAQLAKGAPSFADVAANEWFSGYVAVAKNLAEQAGTTIGRDANTFDPTANVSKAEALVFVMKFLGVKVSSTGANWYEAWIAKAVELGMISEDDAAIALASPGSPATRGEAFVILDFGYSAKVLEGGASLYTAFVDSVKPTVEASAAETTAEATVTVSGKVSDNKGVAAVFVNGAAVEVKDGNFSAEVELKVGKNTIEVSATDVAGNSQSKTLTVTRSNAEAASIEAADVTVAAGAEATVSAKLLDANGAAIADAEITGTSTMGTFANGVFTAGTKAGDGKLTLKSGEITKDVAVKVVAGEIAGVKADKASAAVGAKVTLTAIDAHGNTVEGATFAQESADAFMSGNAFVATKAGSYKVTATANGTTVEYTVSVYSTTVAKYGVTPSASSVVANNATEFTVEITAQDANGNAVLVSGLNTALTWDSSLTQANFEIKTSSGEWKLLSDVDHRSITLENGKKTVTLRTAGVIGGVVQKIKVADGTTASALVGEASIELVDQVATSLKVKAPAKYLANNGGTETAEFDVTVLDQAGKPMKTGAYAIAVAVEGAGAKLINGGTAENSKTLYYFGSATPTLAKAEVRSAYLQSGEITVTASGTGLTSGSDKIIAATAFAASKLDIQQNVTSAVANKVNTVKFDVTSVDSNGVPNVPGTTRTIKATFDVSNSAAPEIEYSLNEGTSWTPLSSGNKVAELTITTTGGSATLWVRSKGKTGDVKVTFADSVSGAGSLAGDAKTITFKSDVAKGIALDRVDPINVAVGEPEVELTAQLYDDAGNAVAEAGKSITFSTDNKSVKLNGGTNSVTVTTDADGVAKVKASLAAYVGETATINVEGASGSGITAITGEKQVTVSVVNSVATNMTYTLTNSSSTVTSTATAGETLTLTVTVKDAGGRPLSGQTLEASVTEGKADATKYTSWTSLGDGKYSTTFSPRTTGRVTLSVKNTTAASELTLPASVSVRADAYHGVRVERADYTNATIKLPSGTATLFRLVPVDQYGNFAPKTSSGDVTVTWGTVTPSAGKYFEIRSSETGAAVSSLKLVPGSAGVTFFVLTNEETSITFTPSTGTTTDAVTFAAQ